MRHPQNRGDRLVRMKIRKSKAKAMSRRLVGDTASWIRFLHQGTPCSCEMCCNPRHNKSVSGREKLTRQEHISNIKLKEYQQM